MTSSRNRTPQVLMKAVINYNYDDVPTLKRFILSRKRYKLAKGPIGCLSGDTEYLTPNGWRRIDEYHSDDLIAQWHPDTGEITFVKPLRYIVLPADTWIDMTLTKHLKMRVSPEHRIPYYNYRRAFRVCTAEEFVHHPHKKHIPVSFTKEGAHIDEYRLRLLVALSADGSKHPRCRKLSITLRKERKKERLRWLLQKLGVDYSIYHNPNRPTEDVFRFYFDEYYKEFPDSWYDLDSICLRIILDEALYWDGGFYTGNNRMYFTSIKKNADFIQFAAHASGRRAYIAKRAYPHKPHWKPTYDVFISARGQCPRFQDTSAVEIYSAPEDDLKYCFEVPTSFFVARYNDTVFITGNSGKSSACVIHLLNTMVQQEPDADGIRKTRYVIIRNTSKQLHDTTKKTIDFWVPEPLYQWKEAKMVYLFNFALEDGTRVQSEWLLRSLDTPDQVRDLLSLEVTGAWINEGKEVREEIFQMLRGRIGRYPPPSEIQPTYPYIIIDTNPPDVEHWIYKFFEDAPRKDPDLADMIEAFHQPSGLSPQAENIRNLPPRYYEDLCIGQDEDFIRVYVHGEYGYVKAGKPVFVNYQDSVHCAKEPIKPVKALTVIVGFDFGLYPACVFTQQYPIGKVVAFHEIVSTEPTDLDTLLIERFIPYINSELRGFELIVVGDPAGKARSQVDSRTCYTIFHSYNIKAYPAYTNALHDRIKAVNIYLTRTIGEDPAFVISPTCKYLRKALISEYKFRKLRVSGDRYSDMPEKNIYSHIAEALQYALLGYMPNFNSDSINLGVRNLRKIKQGYTYRGFV